MQVILTKAVRKLGKVGDKVNVKDGYGRNFLLPRELAIRATAANIKIFDEKLTDLSNKHEDDRKQCEALKMKYDNANLTFISQSAADGKLFGSITSKLIANQFAKHISSENIDYSNVLLDNPIKNVGMYPVKITLHPDVIVNVNVIIARSDSEAQEILKSAKGDKNLKETEE